MGFYALEDFFSEKGSALEDSSSEKGFSSCEEGFHTWLGDRPGDHIGDRLGGRLGGLGGHPAGRTVSHSCETGLLGPCHQ